jgi:hypothetical protein
MVTAKEQFIVQSCRQNFLFKFVSVNNIVTWTVRAVDIVEGSAPTEAKKGLLTKQEPVM